MSWQKKWHRTEEGRRGLSGSEPYLDDGYQALISGGISWHGEPASGVAPGDFVHGGPGRCIGLVFVCHREVGHDDIHHVLLHLAVELHELNIHGTHGWWRCFEVKQ